MPDNGAQADWGVRADWIGRVLGVAIPLGRLPEAAPADYRAVWTDAKNGVDAALGQLARHMLASQDELLQRIAREGLPRLTAQQDSALEVALTAYERAPVERRPAAAAELRSAVSRYQTALTEEAAFGLIDSNPFGIAIAARENLGKALAQIKQSLP